MPPLGDIYARHTQFQDGMVGAFSYHLNAIVLRAQARVLADLQRDLKFDGNTIRMTPANYRIMRRLTAMLVQAMEREGYPALVQSFVGEFSGTLQFLDATLAYLSDQLKHPLPLWRLNPSEPVIGAFKVTAADALASVVEGVAATISQRTMLSVGGLKFADLVSTLTNRFETAIAKARTLADTSMSMFYRTATDRAFTLIEEGLPDMQQRYLYSGPDDALTRPFCEHLLKIGKAYTRDEIGRMDNGQIPNVMISNGGWNCRHQWLLDVSGLEQARIAA